MMHLSFAMIWPIGMVVLCNVIYHTACKSVPSELNPLLSLFVTYAMAATVTALILFFSPGDKAEALRSFSHVNWASFVLGIAVVGLEMGWILAYRAGWEISIASLIGNMCVAIVLLLLGIVFFKEDFSLTRIFGAGLCLIGLFFLGC